MCISTTQFFFSYFFMGNRLDHVRTGDKHMAFFFHHKNKIGQRRRIAGSSGTRSEDRRNLRNHSRGHRILIENGSISGQTADPFLNTGTTRIIQGNYRRSVFQCQLLHLDDLRGIRSAQCSSVSGKVISIDKHLASVYLAIPRNDPVTRYFVLFHTEIGTTVNDKLIQFDKCPLIQ